MGIAARASGRARSPTSYEEGFRLGPDESLEGMLDFYESVAAETDRVVGQPPLGPPVPVPQGVPWFPKDIDAWNVRWVVLHLIEETARHAGHADIVRESIDGATWFTLMSAVENWDLRPWVEPWQPPTEAARATASSSEKAPSRWPPRPATAASWCAAPRRPLR